VDPSWLDDPPRGSVTFCAGEDVSASHRRSLRDYNLKRAPLSRATFEESSFTADAQHGQFLKALVRGSNGCDVIYLDVIYTAEFAARGLLYDMTPYFETGGRRERFDPRAMQTARYDGRLWGVPKQLDAGVLYYRADRVPKPRSWQDVYRRARPGRGELPGLRLQRGAFEGTTVVLLELAYSAGARPIVSADGKSAALDQPQVLEALTFLRNAVRDRVTPDVQQTDLGNLSVYERGRATYLRGWPFVAARLRDDAGTDPVRRATAAGTAITALPPWKAGGNSVAVLGGHNLVIPRSAGNPSAALHLIAFLTSASQVRKDVEEDSQVPVLKGLTNEPGLGNGSLLSAIQKTDVIARPSIDNYAAVSQIISRGVTAILDGPAARSSIRARLREMQRDVQSELDAGQ
jgi:multiple sugar transport system substrate-binding protein